MTLAVYLNSIAPESMSVTRSEPDDLLSGVLIARHKGNSCLTVIHTTASPYRRGCRVPLFQVIGKSMKVPYFEHTVHITRPKISFVVREQGVAVYMLITRAFSRRRDLKESVGRWIRGAVEAFVNNGIKTLWISWGRGCRFCCLYRPWVNQ